MSQEEQTRDEVLRMMMVQAQALQAITAALVAILPNQRFVHLDPLPEGTRPMTKDEATEVRKSVDAQLEARNVIEAAKRSPAKGKPREVLTRPKGKPELPVPTVGERMAMDKATEEAEAEANEKLMSTIAKEVKAIVPVKPGKTLADLHVALQACISKYGMPVAKERLAPYPKMTAVPDSEIGAVIDRLVA